MNSKFPSVIFTVTFLLGLCHADGSPGAAFTYQGRLSTGTNAANGTYDLRFAIYDSVATGDLIAGPLTNAAASLSNGLFMATLDFGAVFDGNPRWLEIAVRTNSAGPFTLLSPRQAITPSPYALYSTTAGLAATANGVAAANIVGPLSLAQLPTVLITNGQSNVQLSGMLSGNGGGLTNLSMPAANLTVPITTSNVILSGATGALALVNGIYSWSGAAYTNGQLGTNAAGIYLDLDGCWLATNGLAQPLADTCSSSAYDSIVQPGGGWEDYYTGATLPIVSYYPGSVGTISAHLFTETASKLTLSAQCPIQFVGDGSRLTGTNNMAITSGVTSDAFDYNTWLSSLGSSFGSYSNWNRFGWQRVSEKIARNQPITLLFNGLGLMTAPQRLVTGIYPKILQYLPLRGCATVSYGLVSPTFAGGATYIPGWDTNWYSTYFLLPGPAATISWSLGLASFPADTFALAYLAGPTAGTFAIQTNNGSGWTTVALVNAYSTARASRVFSWSNPVPVTLQVRAAGQDATTNLIIDLSAYNSTITNGVAAAYYLNYSAGIVQMVQPGPAIVGPVLQSWNPDLILFSAISDPDDVTNFPILASYYKTYAPNASVVACGTYPILTAYDPPIALENTLILQACQRLGYSYFDGHTPFVDHNHMLARGLIGPDGVHATPLGYDTYNDLLLEWLSLFDAAGQIAVSADNWAGLTNSNSYLGLFTGNGSGLTNITSASLASDPASLAKVSGGAMSIGGSGNVGIGTNNPQATLQVVGSVLFTSGSSGAAQAVSWSPGDASWNFSSDRNLKDQVTPVDTSGLLEKLTRLPVLEWNYLGYPQRHIGPMAQDFHALFPQTGNSLTLNDADLHGVALAAIQALNRKLETENGALRTDLKAKAVEMDALKADLEQIKSALRERGLISLRAPAN